VQRGGVKEARRGEGGKEGRKGARGTAASGA
jgi:hypothetical protein